jgi:hypothetical protein
LRIVGRRLFAIMSRSDHHRGPFEGVIPSAPAEPDDPYIETKKMNEKDSIENKFDEIVYVPCLAVRS